MKPTACLRCDTWWVVGGWWCAAGGGRVGILSFIIHHPSSVIRHPSSVFLTITCQPVAQWSHNFRPSYLRLGDVIGWLQPTSVLALTATAPARVAADVCRKLRIPYRTTPDPADMLGGCGGGKSASLEAGTASSMCTVHRVGGHGGWQRENLSLSVVNAPNEDTKVRVELVHEVY